MNYNIRPLGAFEKVFWLLDQVSQVHFVTAIEINEPITSLDLGRALINLQLRHPLFSVCIDSNGYKNPFFKQIEGNEIPLRLVEKLLANQLDIEIAKELATPFDWRIAPLIRVVFIKDGKRPSIIFAVHHSISDGISMTWVIRDLMDILSGKKLAAFLFPPSVDKMLKLDKGYQTTTDIDAINQFASLDIFQRKPGPAIKVDRLKLSVTLTSSLVQSARVHGTTVHGAICAAVINAFKTLTRDWSKKEIRIVNPYSIRTQIGAGEESCLYISSKVVEVDVQFSMKFWDLAKCIKDEMKGIELLSTIINNTEMMRSKVFSDVDVKELSDMLQTGLTRDVMITNLGLIPYNSDFGTLKIESMWGPMVLSGIKGEQTIGVVTIDGALSISVVSRSPLASLLILIEKELKTACL